MSRYAFLLLGIVIMSEPVLSYGYTIKQAALAWLTQMVLGTIFRVEEL